MFSNQIKENKVHRDKVDTLLISSYLVTSLSLPLFFLLRSEMALANRLNISRLTASTISVRWKHNWALLDPGGSALSLRYDAKHSIYSPDSSDSRNKTGKLKATYSHDVVRVDSDVNVDLAGPLINLSAVAAYQGWLAGYKTAFDTQKSKVTANNFALGYTTKDFVLHTNVNDGREFGGLIWQRCNDRLETGVELNWAAGSNNTRFGIGAKYALDRDATVRAKVNNSSQIGLGYQQKLRDGITLTLSTLVDGKNFNAGGHKIGVALELEA